MKYKLNTPWQVVALRREMRAVGLDSFSLEAPTHGATRFRFWVWSKWDAGKVLDKLDSMGLLCGKPVEVCHGGETIEVEVEIRCKRVFAGDHYLLHSMKSYGGA